MLEPKLRMSPKSLGNLEPTFRLSPKTFGRNYLDPKMGSVMYAETEKQRLDVFGNGLATKSQRKLRFSQLAKLP